MPVSDIGALWRAGRLRYKLHANQKVAYDAYRKWEKAIFEQRERGEVPIGSWPRVYVLNCSRRFGKDFLCLLIRIEDCLRQPKGLYSYGTAYSKDIASILIPLMDVICEDCPQSIKPVFKQSYHGTESGFYFQNGSILRLVGLDNNPDGLRGRYSNGMTISEACYVDKLKYVITSVIMPQFQGFNAATLLLNSTPSDVPAHPYKIDFCVDAKIRGAYQKFTIFDNPRLTAAQIEEEIRSQGGLESETCRRELFCEDVRSESRTVVPEFSMARHVVDNERPIYACGYTIVDPAVTDLCAVVCGYYDFERAKLVVAADWAERNASTAKVAKAIRECEKIAFDGITFWKDRSFEDNPFFRGSDTDARIILDLNVQHGIKITGVDKPGKEAARNSLRQAFHNDQIEIRSTAPITARHVEGAIWNKNRTDYERSDALGHVDALDCLIYMWRHVNRNMNPTPPHGILLAKGVPLQDIHYREEYMRRQRPMIQAVKSLLPGRFKAKSR